MRKKLLRLTAVLGALGVIFGAFGAHTLEAYLSPEAIDTFRTGVQYHFVHVLAILGCTALLHLGKKNTLYYAAWAFAIGIFLFSGSLYLLSLEELILVPSGVLGPITPIGGVSFIAGWALLFLSSYQRPEVVRRRSSTRSEPRIESVKSK